MLEIVATFALTFLLPIVGVFVIYRALQASRHDVKAVLVLAGCTLMYQAIDKCASLNVNPLFLILVALLAFAGLCWRFGLPKPPHFLAHHH